MSLTLTLIADVLVGVLLVATIVTSMMLARRIERLKADEHAMRRTIAELVNASTTAERAIAGLKQTLNDCDRTLAERLRTAERYAADLARQIEQGDEVMTRIGRIVESARLAAPAPANEPAPDSTARRLSDGADMAAAITQRAVRRLEGGTESRVA
jgi:biopolymer transport protein ExbB/TolQ